VARIAEIPHGGRQVRGSNEHAIDAGDTRDLLELFKRFSGLYLHQKTQICSPAVFQIIVVRPKSPARVVPDTPRRPSGG